jgi:hypothetical protein
VTISFSKRTLPYRVNLYSTNAGWGYEIITDTETRLACSLLLREILLRSRNSWRELASRPSAEHCVRFSIVSVQTPFVFQEEQLSPSNQKLNSVMWVWIMQCQTLVINAGLFV